jgi:hypothetical protein
MQYCPPIYRHVLQEGFQFRSSEYLSQFLQSLLRATCPTYIIFLCGGYVLWSSPFRNVFNPVVNIILEGSSFQGYNGVLSVERQPTFRRNLLPPSSGPKNITSKKPVRKKVVCWGYVSPKRGLTCNGHGVITRKILLFITIAVRTTNPTTFSSFGLHIFLSNLFSKFSTYKWLTLKSSRGHDLWP